MTRQKPAKIRTIVRQVWMPATARWTWLGYQFRCTSPRKPRWLPGDRSKANDGYWARSDVGPGTDPPHGRNLTMAQRKASLRKIIPRKGRA